MLDNSIPHGGDTQQSDSTIVFWYFYPSDWLRPVLLGLEFEEKLGKVITQI